MFQAIVANPPELTGQRAATVVCATGVPQDLFGGTGDSWLKLLDELDKAHTEALAFLR